MEINEIVENSISVITDNCIDMALRLLPYACIVIGIFILIEIGLQIFSRILDAFSISGKSFLPYDHSVTWEDIYEDYGEGEEDIYEWLDE